LDFTLFGLRFGVNKEKDGTEQVRPSVVTPQTDDGALVSSGSAAAYYGYYVDMDGTVKDEIQAIQRYREISLFPDVDIAIQDIVNEVIPYEDESQLVTIDLERIEEWSDDIKHKIEQEFKFILTLLNFHEKASDIFRKWYVDGRLYYNVLTDKNPKNGIAELRPIEATKIKKVVEVDKERTPEGVEIVKAIREYFVYSQAGFVNNTNTTTAGTPTMAQGVKLSDESVVYIPSGFTDQNTGAVLSYLQKALRSANQLRMLEDAIVIYRLSRAPERRIFYIDVGTLPKAKAEQYVKDVMNRYRNKLVYDARTGEIRDDKKYMSMLEDFWMPRRDGNKGTEITTLQGAQNLGELSDVEYFQHKLYHALNIPISRIIPETGFNLGRSTEITRDEVKFQKFVGRLRRNFTQLFYSLLKTQLILKGVMTEDDWFLIKERISFRFQKDNFFSELKNAEILMNRVTTAQGLDLMLGKYFSVEWVAKNVFQMTDEEFAKMLAQVEQEYAEHPWWFSARALFDQQEAIRETQAAQMAQMQPGGMGMGMDMGPQMMPQGPGTQDQNQQAQ
jgi:hypothetical protein